MVKHLPTTIYLQVYNPLTREARTETKGSNLESGTITNHEGCCLLVWFDFQPALLSNPRPPHRVSLSKVGFALPINHKSRK